MRISALLFGIILGTLGGLPVLVFGHPRGLWVGLPLMAIGAVIMSLIRRKSM